MPSSGPAKIVPSTIAPPTPTPTLTSTPTLTPTPTPTPPLRGCRCSTSRPR